MKTIHYIETPRELTEMASRVREQGDKSPTLPKGATLVFTGTRVHLKSAPGFCLDGKFWDRDIIVSKLVELAGMKAQFGLDEEQQQ